MKEGFPEQIKPQEQHGVPQEIIDRLFLHRVNNTEETSDDSDARREFIHRYMAQKGFPKNGFEWSEDACIKKIGTENDPSDIFIEYGIEDFDRRTGKMYMDIEAYNRAIPADPKEAVKFNEHLSFIASPEALKEDKERERRQDQKDEEERAERESLYDAYISGALDFLHQHPEGAVFSVREIEGLKAFLTEYAQWNLEPTENVQTLINDFNGGAEWVVHRLNLDNRVIDAIAISDPDIQTYNV